jgi:transcription-repair coupling factor (superfamily II helicase)
MVPDPEASGPQATQRLDAIRHEELAKRLIWPCTTEIRRCQEVLGENQSGNRAEIGSA